MEGDEKMKNWKLATMAIAVLSLALLALAGPAAATPPAGTGPEDALTPADEWKQIGPDKSRWYAFHYAGDGSQIQVRLEMEPDGSATFAVWTPAGVRDRGLGLEADPVGHGSPDPYAEKTLTWSGGFNIAGTYYVVIEHSGAQPGKSYYLLTVSGSGVSLSAPTPTPAPKPKPGPKPAAPSKPTGRLVFQTTVGGDFYTIDVAGADVAGSLQRVTKGFDPAWSPGGGQIAFVRWQEPRGVWVVDVDTGHEWRAFDWSEARWPSWSPDGSQVLFTRQHGGRQEDKERCFWGFCFTFPARPNWRLGVVRLADGYFYEPPSAKVSQAPHWSPDGEHVVFAGEQGLRVESLRAQGLDGAVSYLISHDYRDTSPVWSPTGQQVAFVRRQHDHWEVYVVDADGGNLRRLTDTPRKPNGEVGHSASPAWSPDGQYLAFLTDRRGKWEIWVMRANGSGQRPLFRDALDGLRIEYSHTGDRAISWTR